MRVVIIGGGSAGTTCAFELRKLNKNVEIFIIEKTKYLEYSPCALPYLISGEIKNREDIFIYQEEDYQLNQIELRLNSEVMDVNRKLKKVFYLENGVSKEIDYDRLVMTTGSEAGRDYQTLKTIDDVNMKNGNCSVVVGGGMIGTELANALSILGHEVYLFEEKSQILSKMLDKDMAGFLELGNIKVEVNAKIERISGNSLVCNEKEIKFDNLFMCTGLLPKTDLAKKIGLEVGIGVKVNSFLQTSDENIFACGDCVESIHLITRKIVLSQLGTTAVRQAKVVAANLLSDSKQFSYVLNNTITKLGNLYIGSVGVIEEEVDNCVVGRYIGTVRSNYYNNEEKIIVKLICNFDKEIIGGQIIGHHEVAGRLNLIALAIEKKIQLDDVVNMETCYNPASASIFDPVVMAATICLKKINFLKDQND